MAVEVQIVGGPQDGQLLTLNAELMSPPLAIELLEMPSVRNDWDTDPFGRVEPLKVRYDILPSRADDGPAWHAVRSEASAFQP